MLGLILALITLHRVVVTNFRLHHTCSIILWLHSLNGVIRSLLCNGSTFSSIILWLHSLSGVIRSLLCNPSTFSSIILWLHSLSGVIRSLLCNPSTFSPAIIIKWVELARNRNKWLGRTRHPYIRAVHARYHARTCVQIRKRCGIVT